MRKNCTCSISSEVACNLAGAHNPECMTAMNANRLQRQTTHRRTHTPDEEDTTPAQPCTTHHLPLKLSLLLRLNCSRLRIRSIGHLHYEHLLLSCQRDKPPHLGICISICDSCPRFVRSYTAFWFQRKILRTIWIFYKENIQCTMLLKFLFVVY